MKKFQVWKTRYPNSWFSCVPGKNGFLPIKSPLKKLPNKYYIVNEILEKMKIKQNDGKNGYLANGNLSSIIDSQLPIHDLSTIEDVELLSALHRDYCFLASAYSLENCHKNLVLNNEYGLAKNTLPPQLSIPLLVLSEKNEVFPWLDYAYGYGLNNAVLKTGLDPTDYRSYETVRTFNGNESEKGFINVHVAMVAQSGSLLEYQQNCLKYLSENNRTEFNKNLHNHYKIFHSIVDTLQTMWKASKYKEYLSFRTFIMGQIGNKKCYPEENIVYNKGDSSEVHAYRGETGAQDSIIPSIDSFLDLEYPKNKLTEYLFDLRKYRPKDHQEYINFMKTNSKNLKFKQYCLEDTDSCIILLKNLNCLRMFRKKHWNLTKKYIIQNTNHPVATGGTPITTWLPNQLGATLEYMNEIILNIKEDQIKEKDIYFYKNIKVELSDHIQSLVDEVNSLQSDFNDQNLNEFSVKAKFNN